MASATVPQKLEDLRRSYFDAYIKWLEKRGLTHSDDQLEKWDVDHNSYGIKESFGGDEEIYRAGLKMLYQRFFNVYSVWRAPRPEGGFGPAIQLYRKPEAGVIGTKVNIMSEDFTNTQKAYMVDKAERALENCVLRLQFLKQTRKQIIAAFEKSLGDHE